MNTQNKKYLNIVIGVLVIIGIALYVSMSKSTVAPVVTDQQALEQAQPTGAPAKTPASSTSIKTKVVDYSKGFTMNYITAQEWPPKVLESNIVFSCASGSTQKTIDSHRYCITKQSEGAAGSTYTTYTYATEKSDMLAKTSFILRFVQCGNYDEPRKSACVKEQSAFNPDTVALYTFSKISPHLQW